MENQAVSVLSGQVSYEAAPLAQVDIDGVAYRVDLGRGSAIAVSARAEGTWVWEPLVEGRWDGARLRAKGLDRLVVAELERSLKAAARQQAEVGA